MKSGIEECVVDGFDSCPLRHRRVHPWPMRFSSFIPMNIPTAFRLLFTAPTPMNTIFWQWLNQTDNASLNYANQNASSKYEAKDIAVSYSIAASSAVLVGLKLGKLCKNKLLLPEEVSLFA